jgi:hypothetical protein
MYTLFSPTDDIFNIVVGAAVVRQLVKNGMKVVGCSRSIEKN